jgi:hypothetical protein
LNPSLSLPPTAATTIFFPFLSSYSRNGENHHNTPRRATVSGYPALCRHHQEIHLVVLVLFVQGIETGGPQSTTRSPSSSPAAALRRGFRPPSPTSGLTVVSDHFLVRWRPFSLSSPSCLLVVWRRQNLTVLSLF